MTTLQKLAHWILPVVLVLASATAATASAADAPFWPQFHGPRGDNISTETGLLKEWPADGPKLLWTAKGMGVGFATVSIAQGMIYTAGNLDKKTMITALDPDGKTLWQIDNGAPWTGSSPGTRGTPTIDGPRLYHESPLGEVACFDAKTGKQTWSLNILKQFGSRNISWALAESLLIDGERLVCTPGGPQTAMVALNKLTGETVWKSPSAGDLAGYATPSLAAYQGQRMLMTMLSGSAMGVDADRGDLLWQFKHKTSYDVNVLRPIFQDGQVFVSSGYGSGSEMRKITAEDGKMTTQQVWTNKDLDNHHGGVLLLDGYLYGSNHGGKWVCVEWKTGKTMYATQGVGKGSLTCADGMLYTLSENSRMGLVKATPDGHAVISQFNLPKGGEGPSWAHPVVCGGRLYIRHGDFLYCYDVRAN